MNLSDRIALALWRQRDSIRPMPEEEAIHLMLVVEAIVRNAYAAGHAAGKRDFGDPESSIAHHTIEKLLKAERPKK